RLWVAETNEDFQRISVWDASTGQLAKEFFSTRLNHIRGQLNPDHTEMLFPNADTFDAPGLTSYTVDLPDSTWYPAWHLDMPYDQMQNESVLLGNTHIYGQQAVAFNGRSPYLSFAGTMLTANNGKTYISGGEGSIYLFDRSTVTARLAALVYPHRVVH